MSDGVSEFYFGQSDCGVRLRVSEKPCKVPGTEVPVDAPQAVSVAPAKPEMVIVVQNTALGEKIRLSRIYRPDAEVVVDDHCPRNVAWTMSRETYEAMAGPTLGLMGSLTFQDHA